MGKVLEFFNSESARRQISEIKNFSGYATVIINALDKDAAAIVRDFLAKIPSLKTLHLRAVAQEALQTICGHRLFSARIASLLLDNLTPTAAEQAMELFLSNPNVNTLEIDNIDDEQAAKAIAVGIARGTKKWSLVIRNVNVRAGKLIAKELSHKRSHTSRLKKVSFYNDGRSLGMKFVNAIKNLESLSSVEINSKNDEVIGFAKSMFSSRNDFELVVNGQQISSKKGNRNRNASISNSVSSLLCNDIKEPQPNTEQTLTALYTKILQLIFIIDCWEHYRFNYLNRVMQEQINLNERDLQIVNNYLAYFYGCLDEEHNKWIECARQLGLFTPINNGLFGFFFQLHLSFQEI